MLEAGSKRGPRLAVWGLGAVVLLAFALRASGFEQIFTDDETVVFRLSDPNYHVRRALWTLLNFPLFLSFDPYINYPDGAFVPWPPLLDFAVATIAHLQGGGVQTLERVAAWTPPVLGALTTLPIYLLGRHIRSAGLGLAAAAIFACLPAAVDAGSVGNFDHHVAQALLGAVLISLYVAVLDGNARGRTLIWGFAGLVLARSALMLTWQGNLLYLGLGEAALLWYGAAERRRDFLLADCLSAAATAIVIAPVIALSGNSVGGAYSAVELSRLHLLALGCVALAGASLASLEALRPARTRSRASLRVLGISAALGGALLAIPDVRDGLAPALDFLARADEYGARNMENQPLFLGLGAAGRERVESVTAYYGYLILLAPAALLWTARLRERPAGTLLLAAWTALTGVLATAQTRYLVDFAPVGSVGLALSLALAGEAIGRRGARSARLAGPGIVLLGAALLWPAFSSVHFPRGRQTWLNLRAPPPSGDRALLSPHGTLLRFAQAVRSVTPETAGLFEPDIAPDYSILCYPIAGHVLHYRAGRATPANPFGPYIGSENFLAARRFFLLRQERQAVETARRLGARYVMTSLLALPTPRARDTMMQRLHFHDGSGRGGASVLQHFRLVTEGPRGGASLLAIVGGPRVPTAIPHKLFEVVAGAELRVETDPGAWVTATVEVETPVGRTFEHVVRGRADEQGIARLEVPYATLTSAPAHPVDGYRITVGSRVSSVEVSEEDVREGRVIRVLFADRGSGSRP